MKGIFNIKMLCIGYNVFSSIVVFFNSLSGCPLVASVMVPSGNFFLLALVYRSPLLDP